MKVDALSIGQIFGQDRRLVVPLFQRPYVWKREEQWEPLWEDIRRLADRVFAGETPRPHFLGAIVLEQRSVPTGHLETRMVVDGQQRLTTLQVLLEAFCDLCLAAGRDRHYRAALKLVRNENPLGKDPNEVFKVWPTNLDREQFRRVMEQHSPEQLKRLYGAKPNAATLGDAIADAYVFFHGALGEWLDPQREVGLDDRLLALYGALKDSIRMAVIDLDDKDDPQLIFETLNARGTPLLPSDLIKNYLLYEVGAAGSDTDRTERLEQLYREYWKPFDDSAYWRVEVGRGHAKRAQIDVFLHHFLTLRMAEEVPVTHLYAAFRRHTQGRPAVELLSDIRRYGEIYRSFGEARQNRRERLFFERLAAMETTTAHPLLLDLLDRYSDEPKLRTAVHGDLESFLVRRMVCQLSTRAYGKLFIELLNAFRDGLGEPEARVREFLLASDAEDARWPDDDEFGRFWREAPLYQKLQRGRLRMLLRALEERLREPGKTDVDIPRKLTIEHLMPVRWQAHWPLPNGQPREGAAARRNDLVHRIGNLTLITQKLNSSTSNGPWADKRDKIRKYSLLILGERAKRAEEWDEAAIEARGEELFRLAQQIWPHPRSAKEGSG